MQLWIALVRERSFLFYIKKGVKKKDKLCNPIEDSERCESCGHPVVSDINNNQNILKEIVI